MKTKQTHTHRIFFTDAISKKEKSFTCSKDMLQFSQATVKEWPSFKKLKLSKGKSMQSTLTQSQAQYLVTRLSFIAQGEQEYRKTMRMLEGISWAGSDKDVPEGETHFNNLNTIRDNIRASKAEEAKINECIRQLRKVR